MEHESSELQPGLVQGICLQLEGQEDLLGGIWRRCSCRAACAGSAGCVQRECGWKESWESKEGLGKSPW